MQIREELENLIAASIAAACDDATLELAERPAPALERPRDLSNGDWASTVAMRTAKLAHKNPREIAQIIVDHLPENNMIASVEIAGPGFINIKLTPSAFQSVAARVRAERFDFGKGTLPEGTPRNVNLEYVSANPTGPMHVGHGRWATLGDAIARVMRHAGYQVSEEYYINDHGVQMDVFGNSVSVRYMQLLGHDIEMPEKCYGGGYVKDIAQGIIDRDGNKWESVSDQERIEAFREIAYQEMLDLIRETLTGTSPVSRSLEIMNEKGYLYDKDGATWFRSTDFGDDKDRVLLKENGEYTYFMSDVAYHYDKMQRGFDHLIDLWGADHHGYIRRCEAMLAAWGYPGALEVVLGQLVNLFRDGEAVRMSKRTGEMVTFAELIDEVGVDATRFLMLSRSSDQPIDFDIEVAKKKDNSNPVYYVQYAHARICSVLRKAAGEGAESLSADELAAKVIPADVDLSVLTHESEIALMRKMDDFGELVALAARDRAPFRLTHYAQELAGLFHQFYTNCHIVGEDPAIQNARLALADATRTVLALTLDLIGVSAPERM